MQPHALRAPRWCASRWLALAVTALLAAAGVVIIASPKAEAISSCGSGFYRDSVGGMFAQDSAARDGRRVIVKVGGYVTFCHRDRTAAVDQENQRVVLGLPNDMYASGEFRGNGLRQVCLTHSITVHAKNIDSGRSIGISAGNGGLEVGWSASYGPSSTTIKTEPLCARSVRLLRSFSGDIRVTTPNTGWGFTPDTGITRVVIKSGATLRYASGSTVTRIAANATDTDYPRALEPRTVDTTAPVLDKPVASLASPTSRTANYSINASDDSGSIAAMRVKATGDADWRPWVPYSPAGTVILPDRYGDFNIWFQVKDAAGNLSSQRATDILTRVQDLGAPAITGASVALNDPASRFVQYSLAAVDTLSPVAQMRLVVSGEDWRPWVPYQPNGTIVLPDGYGRFGISFQVMDAAGNVSAQHFAGTVTRTAPVALGLHQIDNNGNVRSCGSEAQPCSDIVKRFRVNISSPVLPRNDLLFKAWRNVNGVWVETSTVPFMRLPITGSTIDFAISANLLSGVWRFQAQVPRDVDGITDFGASGYQYLRIS